MKRLLHIAILALFLLSGACTRHKIIPDDELAQIFRDAFLANAYIGTNGMRTDSLKIYEPIFAHYGYNSADVQYTIGNFSKRKSARLGDVVEQAIALLEKEGTVYNRDVAALDTIDNVARRTFTRTVHADSLIRVGALRDTARLKFSFDVQPGEYNLSMNYLIDSLDRNTQGIRASSWLERDDKTRTNTSTFTMRRERNEEFSRRFTVDSSIRRLRIEMLNFAEKPQRPSVTVTDFHLTHTPETPTAVDSLYERQLNIRIFADEFIRAANPKDSL